MPIHPADPPLVFPPSHFTGKHIQNASAARGRGAARGRSGRGRRSAQSHSTLRMLVVPRSDALFFRVVPGRETVVMGVDAVVALIGIVYHGNDGYLVGRDSCFLP